MDDKVKKFIEDNIELIEANEWEEAYRFANKELSMAEIGQFTSLMLSADIHPEKYLSKLPAYFLYESGIKEFIIPDSVTSIGDWAFKYCTNLESIIIPDSLTEIYWCIFEGCTSLTTVTIGDHITEISYLAFSDCSNLTHVIIPNSVIKIRNDAFSDCGDKLNISYSGTKSEWKRVYNSKAFTNTYFTAHCTDGKVVKKKR